MLSTQGNNSHKGKKIEGKPGRRRGESASKRGISDEKVCLLTAVERKGDSFLRSYNTGRPSSDDVMNLSSDIKKGSYLWTDNHSSYNKLTQHGQQFPLIHREMVRPYERSSDQVHKQICSTLQSQMAMQGNGRW